MGRKSRAESRQLAILLNQVIVLAENLDNLCVGMLGVVCRMISIRSRASKGTVPFSPTTASRRCRENWTVPSRFPALALRGSFWSNSSSFFSASDCSSTNRCSPFARSGFPFRRSQMDIDHRRHADVALSQNLIGGVKPFRVVSGLAKNVLRARRGGTLGNLPATGQPRLDRADRTCNSCARHGRTNATTKIHVKSFGLKKRLFHCKGSKLADSVFQPQPRQKKIRPSMWAMPPCHSKPQRGGKEKKNRHTVVVVLVNPWL